jgi:alcohol dehydrogenase class IV
VTGFFTAPKIALGIGSLQQLSAMNAQRVLVVADPALRGTVGEKRVLEEFEKTEARVELLRGVDREPSLADVKDRAPQVAEFRPDLIVALGGGRTIDLAKLSWVSYERPDLPVESVNPLVELGLRRISRMVAIPTTSGSGAEVTWTARALSDGGSVEAASRELVPDWAVLEPTLTVSTNSVLTAQTGMDALARALEALASPWANDLTAGCAREAAAIIVSDLPRARKNPADLETRSRLQAAATLSGLAGSNASSGLTDSLAYALCVEFDRPYGQLAGALLPSVVEFNFPAAREAYASLPSVVGAGLGQNRYALSTRLRALTGGLGAPPTLAQVGIPEPAFRERRRELVEKVRRFTSSIANPRVASADEIGRLLDAAWAGTPVDF